MIVEARIQIDNNKTMALPDRDIVSNGDERSILHAFTADQGRGRAI